MSRLSVVVAVVDGGAALERCLDALATQHQAPELEVLVPWDSTVSAVAALAGRYPRFHFVAMGEVATRRPATTWSGRHELIDRRRSAGMAAATAETVALLEDRGVPRPGWARGVAAEQARLPHGVIGGAVEMAGSSPWLWAIYGCDFGRFQPPLAAGTRSAVSDVNVSYKRRVLEPTRPLWSRRYEETTLHRAIERSGEELYLSDAFVVDELRERASWRTLVAERFSAGRRFAATRAGEGGVSRRLLRALLTPALPALLLVRTRRESRGAGRRRPPRGSAAALALLAAMSSLGELVGELTGRD
jgi:hypothetical protein